MRKDRIFFDRIETLEIKDTQIIHKAKNVLRKKAGDIVYIFNGQGQECEVEIENITQKILAYKILSRIRKEPPGVRLMLAFALIKSLKVDLLLQKCTELGVDEFIPFTASNIAVGKPRENKLSHWNKVIVESSAQSQRFFVPHLCTPVSFSGLLGRVSAACEVFLAEPQGSLIDCRKPFFKDDDLVDVLLIVGPEGGLTNEEVASLKGNKNLSSVRISPLVLRSETASISLVSVVSLLLLQRKL